MPSATHLQLPEATQARVLAMAASKGASADAYMLAAIERQLADDAEEEAFQQASAAALANLKNTNVAHALEDVAPYLRAKAANPATAVPRPAPTPWR
jgi:hypothetical protein